MQASWRWLRIGFWACIVISIAVVLRRTAALAYPPQSAPPQLAALDAAFASHATLTLVHTHATEPAELVIRLRGGTANQVRQTVLSHTRLNAHNTFEQPDNLVPKTSEIGASGPDFKCLLPPASVNRFDIALI